MYTTVAQIKRANEAAGWFFFSEDTLRFFRSEVEHKVYDGHYFLTSEQPPYGSRRWTVRYADDDGKVSTVGPFCEMSHGEAVTFMRRAAQQARVQS